jgi:hypothetical protein
MQIKHSTVVLCRHRNKPDAHCRRRCKLCNRPCEAFTPDRLCKSCASSWNARKAVSRD